jgi:CBS domain containing-hemolysin-like protein
MIEYLVPSLIIIALVLINGLFVAAEFAIIGVRPTRLTQLIEAGNRTAAAIKAIRDNPRQQDRYIATAQIGITLASLGLGMYGEATVAHWIEAPLEQLFGLGIEVAHVIAVVIALSLMTFAHVVVGEMIPKSLALQYAEQTAFGIAGIMVFMNRLFAPAVFLLNAISNTLLRMFGIPPTAGEYRLYSSEELEIVVAESAEGGLLSNQQERLIQNIFDFGERYVAQVMTPRTRISALPITTLSETLPQQLATASRSRLIVYDHDLDHVIGVVLVKEAIKRQMEQPGPLNLRDLVRPMPIIPETARIGRVLAAFKREREHIALVIDEYGGTAGVVTLEDLVEEVVGEVRDEFDTAELPKLRNVEPGVLLVRGDLLLDELRELTNLEVPEEAAMYVETLGGLIVTLLGRPAQVGDQIEIANARLAIEAIEGRAVQLVRITQQQPAPTDVPPIE